MTKPGLNEGLRFITVLTIPNKTLANVTIANVTARPNIMTVMNVGLTNNTPPEKIRLHPLGRLARGRSLTRSGLGEDTASQAATLSAAEFKGPRSRHLGGRCGWSGRHPPNETAFLRHEASDRAVLPQSPPRAEAFPEARRAFELPITASQLEETER